jgi:lipid-A-disaccharide synthase
VGSGNSVRRVAVLAGERSGDQLGARLVRALRDRVPTEFFGVVGPAMAAEGVESIGSIGALDIVGIAAVIPELPRLWRTARDLENALVARRPDVVVTIDSPSFHLRLAPRLRARGLPVVHWVAPQVWAWRRHRARRVHRSVDALACLFPFEPALFGPRAHFTGHPAVERPVSRRPPVLGVAAGSRRSERERLGPVFREVALHLGWPTVEATPPGCVSVVPGAVAVDSVAEMAGHVGFALTCAGTATLELAVAGVPMVVAYQLDGPSFRVARRLVRARWIALPNLLLGRAVVPEHVQELDPGRLAAELESLAGPRGEQMASELLEVRALLGEAPVDAVAELVSRVRRSGRPARRPSS